MWIVKLTHDARTGISLGFGDYTAVQCSVRCKASRVPVGRIVRLTQCHIYVRIYICKHKLCMRRFAQRTVLRA